MNEMKKKVNQENHSGKEEQKWVLVALPKKFVLKRTETYVLFSIGENTSAIVSAKFIRAKETPEYLFVSLPATYEVNCRKNELGEDGKYQITEEFVIKGYNLRTVVKDYEQTCLPNDKLPF